MVFNFLDEKAFEACLRQRPVLPPGKNLTARILAAAWQHAAQQISFHQWLGELFSDFMLPKPAYVLSGLLVAGFLAGFVMTPLIGADESLGNPQMILTDEGVLP